MPRCPHCGESHGPEFHFCGKTGQPLDLGPRLIGQVLLDRYQVVNLLGEGPVGAVLEVEKEVDGQRVRYAAKMLHPRFARDRESVRRFLEDAAKAGSTGHRHIAEVLATGRDSGGAPLVVREFMEGESLDAYLSRAAPLPVGQAVRIARQILGGLSAAHRMGVPNLDLSPGDIFLVENAKGELEPKLVDFGESHIKKAIGEEAVVRSAPYFAPSLASGEEADARADLWATAIMLHQMITGELPFGDSPDWSADDPPDPAPIRKARAEVEPLLEAVLLKALSVDPARRYKDAAAFEVALARATGASPSLAPKGPKPPEKTPVAATAVPEPEESAQEEPPEEEPVPEEEAAKPKKERTGTLRTGTLRMGASAAPKATKKADTGEDEDETEDAAKAPPPKAAAKKVKPTPITAPPASRPRPGKRDQTDEDLSVMIQRGPVWPYVAGMVGVVALIAAVFIVSTSSSGDGDGEGAQASSLEPPEPDQAPLVDPEPRPATDGGSAAADEAPAAESDAMVDTVDSGEPDGAPAEEADAEAEAALVRITIRATPAGAEITLDGEPVGANPFESDVEPSPRLRVIRASSENHVPQTRRVAFDEERTLVFSLVARPRPAKTAARPVRPTRPAKTTSRPTRPTRPARPAGGSPTQGGFTRDNPFD